MIITITTVGYGDIYPTTTMGRLVGVLAMIFGIIYTAMPLAIVGSFFFDAYDKHKKSMQTPSDLAKSVRTKIPKSQEEAILVYLDGSPETENLSSKELVQKIKDDLGIMCGDEPPKKTKKKSMFGGLVGLAAKKKDDVLVQVGSEEKTTPATATKVAGEEGGSKQVQAATGFTRFPSNDTGDVLNGGSKYSSPTPLKPNGARSKSGLEKAVPKPNLLPLVMKRMIRRLGHQQKLLVGLGRVVHHMVAERATAEFDPADV